MDVVEVDVRLFITCRLCLNEPGGYPIVPSIKEEIKYCFDIDIEPFDGLPQLICKKCKLTLSDYKTTKSTFIQNQQQLQEKLGKQINNSPQPSQEIIGCIDETSESDTPATDHVPVSPEVPAVCATPAAPVAPAATDAPVAPQDDWKQVNDLLKGEYNEHFVCNICSKSYQKRSSIKRHVSSHKKIINKHKKIFRNYCIVRLDKIDDKENCIGVSEVVVYNREKIIVNQGNSRFHTFYLKNGEKNENVTAEKKSSAIKRRLSVFSDSSDEQICKGKKRKSRRLFSCSSTQTEVLEESKADCNISNNLDAPGCQNNSNNADLVNTDCINIDDTSSDCPPKNKLESGKAMVLRKKQAKAKIANYKAIQKIVAMCQKKYIKKAQSENVSNKQAFSESSLKHKVLSLGRKVIHKQGFGCTGLLRYMEHKDLDITWQPTSHAIQNKGSSFVRIMTNLKSREDSENDDLGWKELHEISFCSDREEVNGVNPEINNTIATIMTTTEEEPKTLSPGQSRNEDLLYQLLTTSDLNNKNKLLNKTPVANPKQLPKKVTASDIKPVTIKADDVDAAILIKPMHESGELDNLCDDENNFCMPIITSTQSLSTANEVEIVKDKPDRSTDKPPPRIKVKPASELMTERALNNQDATEDIWAFNKRHASLPYHFTDNPAYAAAPMCQSQDDSRPNHASAVVVTDTPTNVDSLPADTTHVRNAKNKNDEYVTLHSLELPNTKTKLPFQYFKTVLIYHGLNLLELNEELPKHFKCLIRFKLCLKQDTKRPLEVVLALFCSENNFCFAFKDAKLKTFDPNQLPAFWQWELLKVYKSDVVSKIMQNAEKIGKEVYDYTKNFLCLLKSIHCISEA